MQDIISLDEREYFYLDERFDIMTSSDVENLPKYIVTSRKEKFRQLVRLAVENELKGTQKQYMLDRYFGNLNITQIAEKYRVSRQNVYSVLDKAQKNLYSALKYAYCCGFSLLVPPDSFENMAKILKKEQPDENNNN